MALRSEENSLMSCQKEQMLGPGRSAPLPLGLVATPLLIGARWARRAVQAMRDVSNMVSHANRAVLLGQSGRFCDGRARRPWHVSAKPGSGDAPVASRAFAVMRTWGCHD